MSGLNVLPAVLDAAAPLAGFVCLRDIADILVGSAPHYTCRSGPR
ncbi:hypothetical protein [Streptomyces iranensis]|uniref:Uncharacterized protein n=1 Tax=Streptomyces iranensis TaxID=576784 RepID=A0A060ZYR8_9ACTN|nr:hypothetical protein [Streptomyces iranensis]MBP2064654.1 hypothetical protein [Streptomyces iranensis]CDR12590.1 predicted protein [Streptomyces iranensis]